MSERDYRELDAKIVYGLEVAEHEMLVEKAIRGESVIVCDAKGTIRRVPATEYLH